MTDASLRIRAEIDLTRYEQREYSVHQRITVRPPQAGSSITLFGVAMTLGRASHGYAYDGHRVTFCTAPFAAGEDVTVDIDYVVSEKAQAFPKGSLAGMRVWGEAPHFAIGPFSSPFFASTWLLVPQSIFWIDEQHAGNVALDAVELSVKVPGPEWTVIGPGESHVDGDRSTWSFVSAKRMPLYSLAFAASPAYEKLDLGVTKTGIRLSAGVFDVSRSAAQRHIAAAGKAIDIMTKQIGVFAWEMPLRYAEIPEFAGGMEHTGSIWLGAATFDGGDIGDYTAIHETVHHWWGDDVRIADWPHFWMSEGFTEWTTVFALLGELTSPEQARSWKKRYRSEAAKLSAQAAAKGSGPLRFDDGTNMMTQVSTNLTFFYRYGAAFLEMVNQRLQRDHQTELQVVLADWYAQKRGQAVTTEEFRDFLAAKTKDAATWKKLFDEWVYAGPSPTIEVGRYVLAGGSAELELRRIGGANQDLRAVEVSFLAGATRETTYVDLPAGTNSVKVKVPMGTTPDRIAIDPQGLYILQLTSESGWSGPPIDNTLL